MALDDLRVEEQDLTSGDLTLDARDGESIEILAQGVAGASDEALGVVSIREETMLAFQADDGDDELLLEETVHDRETNFLRKLRQMGFTLPTIKVPEGQTYTLTTDDDSGNATVLYREAAPDFASGGPPGAPGNKDRVYIGNGQTTQNIGANATEVVDLTDSVNPGELSRFPHGEDAPSGFEYDLVALAVALDNSADADHTLDNVRLNTEETNFLAREDDRVDAAFFNYPDTALDVHPFVFSEPPTIVPGQELDIEVEVTDSGGASADTVVNSAAVFHRRVPGGG